MGANSTGKLIMNRSVMFAISKELGKDKIAACLESYKDKYRESFREAKTLSECSENGTYHFWAKARDMATPESLALACLFDIKHSEMHDFMVIALKFAGLEKEIRLI